MNRTGWGWFRPSVGQVGSDLVPSLQKQTRRQWPPPPRRCRTAKGRTVNLRAGHALVPRPTPRWRSGWRTKWPGSPGATAPHIMKLCSSRPEARRVLSQTVVEAGPRRTGCRRGPAPRPRRMAGRHAARKLMAGAMGEQGEAVAVSSRAEQSAVQRMPKALKWVLGRHPQREVGRCSAAGRKGRPARPLAQPPAAKSGAERERHQATIDAAQITLTHWRRRGLRMRNQRAAASAAREPRLIQDDKPMPSRARGGEQAKSQRGPSRPPGRPPGVEASRREGW